MNFSSIIHQFKSAESSKDAVKIYKQLCEWLEKNSPYQERKLDYFIIILNKHMISPSSSVRISSLKACGYLLKHISIRLSDKQEDSLIDKICKGINNNKSKSTQYHACWCLSVQRLPPECLQRNFEKIYLSLLYILENTIENSNNEAIDIEALKVLGILCEHCSCKMKECILSNENYNGWIHIIIKRFVGKGSSRSYQSRILFQQAYPLIYSLDSYNKILLGKEIKYLLCQGILSDLELYIQEPSIKEANQEDLLKIWGYLILLLQEKVLFKDAKFLNRLLAIINKAFLHPSNEIQLQSYDSWKFFICLVSTNIPKLIRHKQRLSIVLSPSLRALTKSTNKDIRINAYHVYAQIIYHLAEYKTKDKESILCVLFDEILLPLKEKVIENPINEEYSPSLVHFVIELFANLLYTRTSSSNCDKFIIEHSLVQEEMDDIPLLSNNINIPYSFIHQRLSFFLEILAYCLNHKNINIYQQDCKANLISIWENLIIRIFNSIEYPEEKSSALHSIKKLIVFPFSYPSTSQYLCDNWTVIIREELLSSLLSHVNPKIIVSNQYKLSWRAESIKLPIAVFLCCCWIQSIREGLCGQEQQIKKEITCSIISKCQLSVFRSILKMIQQNSLDSTLDNFDCILRQLIPGEKDLLQLEDLIPLWCTFCNALTEYIKETNDIGISSKFTQGHPVIYHTLELPLGSLFIKITEQQLVDNDIILYWENLYISFRSSIMIKSLKGEWKSQLIHCLPDISVCSSIQLSLWTIVCKNLVNSINISSKKKEYINESITIFTPIINSVFQHIHNSINYKEDTKISASGLYLLSQGIKMIEYICNLFKFLSSLHKQQLFLITLDLLKSSLLTWFSNPKPRSSDITVTDCDKFRSSIEKLWKTLIITIKECKDTYNEKELLYGIEFILSNALNSKFRWIKTLGISLWNSIFYEYDSSYPPNLYNTLLSLKDQCDIIIPKNNDNNKEYDNNEIKHESSNDNINNNIMDIDSLPDVPEIDEITSFSPQLQNYSQQIKKESSQELKKEQNNTNYTKDCNNNSQKKEYKTLLHKRKKRPPLTESQKEKRREQQQNTTLWNDNDNDNNNIKPLTTQEISDELWGIPDIPNEMANKKRKLENTSLDIYNNTSSILQLNSLSTNDYINILNELSNNTSLPNQLSIFQLIEAQRSITKLMNILIDKIDDNQINL